MIGDYSVLQKLQLCCFETLNNNGENDSKIYFIPRSSWQCTVRLIEVVIVELDGTGYFYRWQDIKFPVGEPSRIALSVIAHIEAAVYRDPSS